MSGARQRPATSPPPARGGPAAPEGVVMMVPDEPPDPSLAPGVADCVAQPLVAQFTWDALTVLIEACRRERVKNWEAIRAFNETGGQAAEELKFDGHDRPELYQPALDRAAGASSSANS